MNKDVAIIIPHKGLGDIIFHHSFIKSIYKKHNKKIILFANKSTKVNFIYNKSKYIKKIKIIDLKRPNFFLYIFKMFKIFFHLYNFKYLNIYYTGNAKWHKITLKLLSKIKRSNLYYSKKKNKYIINFLSIFLKNINIKDTLDFKLNVPTNITKVFKKKLSKFKKPWVFLSIDTSADQIQIPNKFLFAILSKLKKNYGTIFVNTSVENKNKKILPDHSHIVKTSNFNITEINYIIKYSNFFIGNESGPAVLATLLKKKMVIFLNKKVIPESTKMPGIVQRRYFHIHKLRNNYNNFLNIL